MKNLYEKSDSMTISERVQEVFQRFNVNLTVTEEPRTELAEAVLENGTVIYTDADDFTEGAEAYIINDEGERIPLPQGDYTLNDGSVLVIADGGKVASRQAKGKDGGDGKGDGNSPKTKQPESSDSGESRTGDSGGTRDSGDSTDSGDSGDGGRRRTRAASEEEEDMEEVTINYVTREEVEALIAEAIAALAPSEEPAEEVVEEEVEAEDKEEMSSQEPQVEEVVEEVVEEPQEDPVAVELAAVKAELEEMKKQAAEGGLKHAAPTTKSEAVNLKNLSTSERVSALLNQFS